MQYVIVADGASALPHVPVEGWVIWVVAAIAVFLVLRLVLRIVKKLVGVALVLVAIVILGGGGLGVLTGIL